LHGFILLVFAKLKSTVVRKDIKDQTEIQAKASVL